MAFILEFVLLSFFLWYLPIWFVAVMGVSNLGPILVVGWPDLVCSGKGLADLRLILPVADFFTFAFFRFNKIYSFED